MLFIVVGGGHMLALLSWTAIPRSHNVHFLCPSELLFTVHISLLSGNYQIHRVLYCNLWMYKNAGPGELIKCYIDNLCNIN